MVGSSGPARSRFAMHRVGPMNFIDGFAGMGHDFSPDMGRAES